MYDYYDYVVAALLCLCVAMEHSNKSHFSQGYKKIDCIRMDEGEG